MVRGGGQVHVQDGRGDDGGPACRVSRAEVRAEGDGVVRGGGLASQASSLVSSASSSPTHLFSSAASWVSNPLDGAREVVSLAEVPRTLR